MIRAKKLVKVKSRTVKIVEQPGRTETTERVTTRTERTTKTLKRPKKPQGVVLYRGPSLLNGKPIVCVATGLARKSRNPKTGDVIQTWILCDDGESPLEAIKSRADEAICGDCPHREGSCYVNVSQAPLAVYKAVQTGRYPTFDPEKHDHLFRGRFLRLGSYGDPTAAPLDVWKAVCELANGWAGYTHQWASCDPGYSRYCMASVETPLQREDAIRRGYRTFRVRLKTQPVENGEFICPASEEGGYRRTCSTCRACGGTSIGGSNTTPVIVVHGSSLGNFWKARQYERTVNAILASEERRINIPLVN